MNKKIFLAIGTFLLIGIMAFCLFAYAHSQNSEIKRLQGQIEQLNFMLNTTINQGSDYIKVSNDNTNNTGLSSTYAFNNNENQTQDPIIVNPLPLANPRQSYLNSSMAEVIGLDHLGNIGFVSNLTGTNFIYNKNLNRVGIGTTTPAYLLETSVSAIGANLSGVLYVNGTSGYAGIGTTAPLSKLQVSDTSSTIQFGNVYANYGGIGFGTGALLNSNNASLYGNGTNTYLNTPLGGVMYFRINNANKIVMDSTGYFGIGTTSPVRSLHVVDAGSGQIQTNGTSATGWAGMITYNNANKQTVWGTGGSAYTTWAGSANNTFISVPSGSDMIFYLGNGFNERVRFTTGGLVGIGTTSPAYLLETAKSAIGANLSGVLYVNGTAGKVGIGTTNPTHALNIVGSGILLNGSWTGNAGSYFSTSEAYFGGWTSGIGITASGSAYDFYGAGNSYFGQNVTVINDIVAESNAWGTCLNINAVSGKARCTTGYYMTAVNSTAAAGVTSIECCKL